ncbi:hypothetical protein [Bacillus cihuensis]|uniref:hypothetical protein n=1 Tax=Bacillus cihuensis TaxID=1208599 RepID=UPI0003FDE090|nr:hypothetical protein [Bacillus cihuensis]
MRDVLKLPISHSETLIISCDNSGGIGIKEKDVVKVPYEVTAYYSFRVAVMECMAAGAIPIAVTVQNFCGEAAWDDICTGVLAGQKELGLDLPITGSTESNLPLLQSALGMIVIGKWNGSVEINRMRKVAIIGHPLVGNEVIEKEDRIAPLSLFKAVCEYEDVVVLPVGSKGIAYEWRKLSDTDIPDALRNQVNVDASAGPSTCFLISYPDHLEEELRKLAGYYFVG